MGGNLITTKKLEKLHSLLKGGPVLILTHDSPDPDALASGKALAFMLKTAWKIDSKLMYSGLVARAENRAMLNLLTPEWQYIDGVLNLKAFTAVVLVDTQPTSGNNSLSENYSPQVVIDHHQPIREALQQVEYVDVRPGIGATTSMVYQYLEAVKIEPDPALATAMFYGLQTDTRGLARGASPVDEKVYMRLLRLLDRKKLIQVEQAGLSREYYRAFNKGLLATRVFGKAVYAYLGEMHRPDFPAEMADILIRLESARVAMCMGYHGDTMYLSLRTEPLSEQDAGLYAQRLVIGLGKAGGHGTIAGGQIKLTEHQIPNLVLELEKRYLEITGETPPGEALI
jgi:nanoRNase/pAp phosphatase (c-di-AMP/oligoRNAs hydrolase)